MMQFCKLSSSVSAVTRCRLVVNPIQILSDSAENARVVVVSTARTSTNHTNGISPSLCPRVIPLIQRPTTVTYKCNFNQCLFS